MKEDISDQAVKYKGSFYTFTYAKNIRTWQELLNALKPTNFDESLNICSTQQIEQFWRIQLEQLSKETLKICILVPVEIKSKIAIKSYNDASQPNESTSPNQKDKNKNRKNNNQNKVILDKKVVEIAMKMIEKDFPKLSYDYASLFIGNQKQLLIYRCCFAIESYIEKYRLPNTFKESFAYLEALTEDYFYLKVQRNKAISIVNKEKILEMSKKIENILAKIRKAMNQFKTQWKQILYDFRSKTKCKDLILRHVGAELVDQLRPLCLQCGTDIINRYTQCDLDQYKDIIVIKKEDPRLQIIQYQRQESQKIIYRYIEPQKQPQPPLDINNLQFIRINSNKQCYTYQFFFNHSNEYNMPLGLFIRSQHGDQNYQLNINIQHNCKDIIVDIYPYREGKSVYEIYIWNNCGFTMSTERIVLYNQMPFNKQGKPIQNYHIDFIGKSKHGLRYCEDDNDSEIIPFKYSNIRQTARNMDIWNSAIICDVAGDVAIWGETYNPFQDQQNKELSFQQSSAKAFKIETPSILLSKKYIRKVSCGSYYFLMLSIFGQVYSMGVNSFGQLGLGHVQVRGENYSATQICKFTNLNSPFIVDIHASVSNASFALNSKGQLYRWGKNQVEQTAMDIEDRFNSIINYSATPIIYKNCNPSKVSKKYIREPISQIISGNNFYFALTNSGQLYGWGQCQNLGINWLQDKEERIVLDIVNPIEIMKNIKLIIAGFQHVIIMNKEGRIFGWGDVTAFSNQRQIKFTKLPIDVTQQYGGKQQIKIIRAGKGYTTILTHQNQLKILGQQNKLTKCNYKLNGQVKDLVCGKQEFMAILTKKKT